MAQEKIDWQQPPYEKPRKQAVHSRKVKKKTAPTKQFVALFLALSIMAGIGAETVHLTVVKGAQIRDLRHEVATLKQENDLLSLEVQKLRSISRIESEALAMGMEKPAGTVYVAGVLPEIGSRTGTVAPQLATAPPDEPKTESLLKDLSQMFTSFFASTQR